MILFKKLRYKNFLSSGNIFTEIDLCKSNTTLIVGENGAGKSTILDALTFSLFGKPYRKVNKPQLVNSITNKNCLCEIEFTIGKQNYKIIRGIKPSVFEVYRDGELINQTAESKDYQEIVEKQILRINYKTFCQVVILGSASYIPFMQLTTGQRREIIEDLLDLQIFTTMNLILKDKISDNGNEIQQTQSEQKIINEKIALINQHIKEMQSNNEKLTENKREMIEDTKQQISQLEEKQQQLLAVLSQLNKQLSGKETLEQKLNDLLKFKHKIEANKSIIDNDIDFFENNDNCPTCKQVIDEMFKNQTLEEKKSKINELVTGLTKIDKQHEQISKQLTKLNQKKNEFDEANMELFKIKNTHDSLTKYCQRLEDEITSIKHNHIDVNFERVKELQQQLDSMEGQYNNLQEHRQILANCALLLKDTGIKSKIIKQYVPIINKLINKYLSSLDFFVQFELNENFEETIKSRFRDEFSYGSFSEGEKMRINLAVLFTWRAVAKLRNSVNTNLLILDEVFDSSLDVNGTEEFLKIINNLTTNTNTFIISHKTDQMVDKFQTVLRFVKNQNFSRIM